MAGEVNYTVTSKLINIEDWSEVNVESWIQQTAKKNIVRPIAVNPQYLMIYTSSEIIVFNRYGHKVLEMNVEYTVNSAKINNNGDILVRSGSTIYIYNISGELLYQNTFSTSVSDIAIGTGYAWVSLANDPRTIYIIDLSDFTVSSISVDVDANQYYPLECSEIGNVAVMGNGKDNAAGSFYFLYADGTVNKIDLGVNGYVKRLYIRPDGIIALITAIDRTAPATRAWAVRSDGVKAGLGSFCANLPYIYECAVISNANADRIVITGGCDQNLYKRELNIDTMSVVKSETISPPGGRDSLFSVDLTPDGKYIVVAGGTKVTVIDWETNEVKKEIEKAISYSIYRVIVAEVEQA